MVLYNRKSFLWMLTVLLTIWIVFTSVAGARINENLDISRFPKADLYIELVLEKGDDRTIIESDIKDKICDRDNNIALERCSIIKDLKTNKVYIRIKTNDISYIVKDFAESGNNIEFTMEYDLFGYSVKDLYTINQWNLDIVVPDRRKLAFFGKSQIPIVFAYKMLILDKLEHLTINLDQNQYLLGETIGAEIFYEGKRPNLCYYMLYDDIALVERQFMRHCKKTLFETDKSMEEANYYVHATSLRFYSNGVVVGSNLTYLPFFRDENGLVAIGPAGNVTDIRLEGKPGNVWYDGTPIIVHISSEDPKEQCRINVSDNEKNVIHTKTFACHEIEPVSTQGLESGSYVMEVFNEDEQQLMFSKAIKVGQRLNSKKDTLSLDKGDFYAGETVAIPTKYPLHNCKAEIISEEGYNVAFTELEPCNELFIDIPPKVETGTYFLVVKVYDEGKIISSMDEKISIGPIRTIANTDFNNYCQNAVFSFEGGTLRCILEDTTCIPKKEELPSCLCFNNDGILTDVCRFNNRCTHQGCVIGDQKPYIIAQNEESCTVRRGQEIFPCILVGEECSGSCACIKENSVIDRCAFNEICTDNGCVELKLQLTLLESEVGHITRDRLDTDMLSFQIQTRYKDELSSIDVSFTARIGEEEASVASVSRINEGLLRVQVSLPDGTLPGKYPLYLTGEYEKSIYTLRKVVEVWYSDTSQFYFQLKSVPSMLSSKEIASGLPITLKFALHNDVGEMVTHLTQSDFAVILDEKEHPISEIHFDPVRRVWFATVMFRGEVSDKATELRIEASELGRSGSVSVPMTVVPSIPPSISIVEVRPKEVFQTLAVWGFDLELLLEIKGHVTNIQTFIQGKEYPNIIIPRPTHYIAQVFNIGFCPEVKRPGNVPFTVKGRGPEGEEITTSDTFYITENPGEWLNPECIERK